MENVFDPNAAAVADSAAADRAGHGRIADQRDDQKNNAVDHAGNGFLDVDPEQDLPVICAVNFCCFNNVR